jgi:hypothetical protein
MVSAFFTTNVTAMPPVRSLLGKAVFQTEEGRLAYRQRLRELFERLYRVEALTNRVHREIARLSTNGLTQAEVVELRKGGEDLCDRIQAIAKSLARDFATLEPQAPTFDAGGVARLSGWQFQTGRGTPKGDQAEEGGQRALHIVAGGRLSSASWCIRVVLPPGKYHFAGRFRTKGVEPDDARLAPGAGLFVTGDAPRKTTTGDSGWHEDVRPLAVKGGPLEVDLVCQLRANAGEAWFDADSLVLVRER